MLVKDRHIASKRYQGEYEKETNAPMFLPTTKTGVVSMRNIRTKKLCKKHRKKEKRKRGREGGESRRQTKTG
jgi:hypothetical protein